MTEQPQRPKEWNELTLEEKLTHLYETNQHLTKQWLQVTEQLQMILQHSHARGIIVIPLQKRVSLF